MTNDKLETITLDGEEYEYSLRPQDITAVMFLGMQPNGTVNLKPVLDYLCETAITDPNIKDPFLKVRLAMEIVRNVQAKIAPIMDAKNAAAPSPEQLPVSSESS